MPPPAPHEGPPRGLVAGVSSRACGSEPALGLRQLDSKDTGDCPGAPGLCSGRFLEMVSWVTMAGTGA